MSIRQYWVAYDLSNDRERARVERCVARYGRRLQRRVFVCVLDVPRYSRLLCELAALTCASGSVALAALSDPGEVVTIGQAGGLPQEDWVFSA